MITYNCLLIHLNSNTSFTLRNLMGMFLHWQYWMKLRRVTNTFLSSTASARSDLKLRLLLTIALIIPNSDPSVAYLLEQKNVYLRLISLAIFGFWCWFCLRPPVYWEYTNYTVHGSSEVKTVLKQSRLIASAKVLCSNIYPSSQNTRTLGLFWNGQV